MTFRDLVAADAKRIFLVAGMPDVESIQYRARTAEPESAITIPALVERDPATRAGGDQGRTVETPVFIEIAVQDVAQPAIGDWVKLAVKHGEAARWTEITRVQRSDPGIHRLEVGR